MDSLLSLLRLVARDTLWTFAIVAGLATLFTVIFVIVTTLTPPVVP